MARGQYTGAAYIQPMVSRDYIAGTYGDKINVAITVPLVDGQVNSRLICFLEKEFSVAKSRVILEKRNWGAVNRFGSTSPSKFPSQLHIYWTLSELCLIITRGTPRNNCL